MRYFLFTTLEAENILITEYVEILGTFVTPAHTNINCLLFKLTENLKTCMFDQA